MRSRTYTIFFALMFLFCMRPVALLSPAGAEDADDNALPPLAHTSFCLRYPSDCKPTPQSDGFPSWEGDRYQQLVRVNTQINNSIELKAAADEVDLDWTIAPTEGDCDDYAVTKRHELLKAGWPSSKLLLAEVAVATTGEHHLLLIANDDHSVWVLDNLQPSVLSLADARGLYMLLRMQSASDPRFWTKSFVQVTREPRRSR